MGYLTIRVLDDRVIERLKAQAKANHRSLEDEIRYVLRQQVAGASMSLISASARVRSHE